MAFYYKQAVSFYSLAIVRAHELKLKQQRPCRNGLRYQRQAVLYLQYSC